MFYCRYLIRLGFHFTSDYFLNYVLLPVSYTHLDVYKRQILMSLQRLIGSARQYGKTMNGRLCNLCWPVRIEVTMNPYRKDLLSFRVEETKRMESNPRQVNRNNARLNFSLWPRPGSSKVYYKLYIYIYLSLIHI